MTCSWRLASPMDISMGEGVGGYALAVAELHARGESMDGRELDAVIERLCGRGVGLGEVRLRRIEGVDEVVVARVGARLALIFPHGGRAILAALGMRLKEIGVERVGTGWGTGLGGAREVYVEAGDECEAGMLAALSRAQSPMAVDVLLDQPRRWRLMREGKLGCVSREHAVELERLIEPATVAAVGLPNVGKSSLLNALAKRNVSIVADVPGTTRDHVGVRLELAGVVAQYLDCPGWEVWRLEELLGSGRLEGRGEIEAEAFELSLRAAREAELVLLCGDPVVGFLPTEMVAAVLGKSEAEIVRVMLRSDLMGEETDQGGWGVECVTSVREGVGLMELTQLIRERLVSEEALGDEGYWDPSLMN